MKPRTFSIASIVVIALALTLSILVTFVNDNQTGLDSAPSSSGDSLPRALQNQSGDMESLSTMYRTITLVQQHYLDASRIVPRKMLLEAMKELELDVAMLIAREDGNQLRVKIGNAEQSFALDDLKSTWLLLSRFKDIFAFIKANIKSDAVDFTELQYIAINGMLKALDPHTVLLTPDIYRSMKDRTHGNFGGLGIVISIKDGDLTIISPIDGTPAQRAGLQAGDVITKIDEASTVNMPINDAVDLMRGKPGTAVSLQIQRKGWPEERTFVVKRAIIQVRSIDSALMPGKVGYVRIHDFQANTANDLRSHLQSLSKGGALKGLVLDLRSNPGGLLTAAIDVSDIFLKKGVIVTTAGQKLSERKVESAQDDGIEPDYPIVILVNSGTASASEIVAGALKGHNRAVVIGERTFGKGSVQVLNEFPDNSALKLTTAQYLTPGDVSIQSVGIPPHIELMKLRAGKQAVHLRKSIRYREGDLSRHLENTGNNSQDHSQVLMKYVVSQEAKPEAEAENDSSEEMSPDEEGEDITEQSTYNFKFEPDFEITLAKDVALRLNAMKAQSFDMAVLEPILNSVQKQEAVRLVNLLRKLGIDWSEGVASASTIEVHTTISSVENLQAGAENEFSVSITNTGTHPIYQLLAMTRSDFGPLNQREIAFGKIPPNATITRTLPFKIPLNYPSRIDDVKVSFEDFNQTSFPVVATRFGIDALPQPVFAFNTLFMDDVKGNGDGLLQPGEIVRLVTTIKNAGKGKALSVFASLSNESGNELFMTKGRQKLETIEPGETKHAEFEFEVKKGFSLQAAKLKLSVMDVELRVFTTQALNYPILPPYTVSIESPTVKTSKPTPILSSPIDIATTSVIGEVPEGTAIATQATANQFYRFIISDSAWGWIHSKDCVATNEAAASNVPLHVNEPPKIDVNIVQQVVRKDTILLQGIARDEQMVKDLYIFNNQNKVFFAPNQGKELQFSTPIPLEPGINYITIVAEETAELETRQTIVIRRDDKSGMPFISSEDIEGTPEPLGTIPTNQFLPIAVHKSETTDAPISK